MYNTTHELRTHFHQLIQKYKLRSYNISALLSDLSDKITQEPRSEELQQLLVMTLCAGDELLAHFGPPRTAEDEEYTRELAVRRIAKMNAAIANERLLPAAWEEIKRRKTLPDVRKISGLEAEECQAEARHLSALCKKYIYGTDKDCPELYNNLLSFAK